MNVKLISPRKDKTRVLLEASADGDEVQPVLLQQIVRKVSVVDHADCADCQLIAEGFLDFDGEGSLVCGFCVRVLQRVVAAGADVEDVDALVGENPGELDCVVAGPGFFDLGGFFEPVGGADAEEDFAGLDVSRLFGARCGYALPTYEACCRG